MRRAGLLASAAFAFVLAAIVYVPVAQMPLEHEPDLSFRVTTHDAFARRLQLGRDIVSTYGPWGILQRGYDRRTDAAVLAVSALLAAAFAWGVFRLSRDGGAPATATAAIALAASGIVAAAGLDGRFTVLVLLLVLSMLEPWSPSRELPLAAALGVVALIKFSLFVFAVLVVVGVAMARRRVAHLAVFAGALLVFWVAAGQELAGLPRFIARGAEVARGYGAASAMGSGVPLALLAAVGLTLFCAAVERDVVRTALVGGAALLVVRIGYIRADLTHTRVADALLLLLIGGYLLIRRDTRRVRLTGGVAVGIVALLVGLPVLAYEAETQWSWLRTRGERLGQLERELAVRSGAAFAPAVAGTIDSYPWGSAALIVSGRRYAPRPVFQSCMAWTAKLAGINAEALRGSRAPEWLWVDVGAIDGHLPLLDDGPSWLEMVRRYNVAAARDGRLLLHRAAAPKPLALDPLLRVAPRFGEEVAIPEGGLLWCTIDINVPLATRIRDVAGRAGSAMLELTTADGARSRWRAGPDVLRSGFLLSPRATNVEELALLLAGDDRHRVARLRVWYDGQRYALHVSAVRTPRPASRTAPAPSAPHTSPHQ